MDATEVEAAVRAKLLEWATPEEALDGAIYQDMGINGQDFYELPCEIDDEFKLPAFDWNEFADMNEPPDGITFWRLLTLRGPKILPRKRLTLAHLSKVIAEGNWSEP